MFIKYIVKLIELLYINYKYKHVIKKYMYKYKWNKKYKCYFISDIRNINVNFQTKIIMSVVLKKNILKERFTR